MGGDAPRLTQFLSDEELTELVFAFPAVEFAFAYGSGVVQQQASTAAGGGLDWFLTCGSRLWQVESKWQMTSTAATAVCRTNRGWLL